LTIETDLLSFAASFPEMMMAFLLFHIFTFFVPEMKEPLLHTILPA
jgi:hypothetical protein